jgi:hypothetical protein
MTTETLMCVGGSRDGRFVTIPAGLDHWAVTVTNERPFPDAELEGLDITVYRREYYGRVPYRAGTLRMDILALEGMSPEETLRTLIHGYRQPGVDVVDHASSSPPDYDPARDSLEAWAQGIDQARA